MAASSAGHRMPDGRSPVRSSGGAAQPAEPHDGAAGAGPHIGDDTDLTILYEAEAPRLRRWLARSLSHDRAADLVHTAFARLLGLGKARIAALDQPGAYLSRIAGNLVQDERKTAIRHSQAFHVSVDDCVLAGPDPVAALEARDLLNCVNASIEALPDRTREIFMAHRFEDMTYPEIAARMGLSIKTVEKHISLALRHLHRSLEDRP